MTWQEFVKRLRDRRDKRHREAEYNIVLHSAALLGQDAGVELFYMSHPDDPPPKKPDPSIWMRWSWDMPAKDRDQALLFNAQMSYANARVEGFVEAFELHVFDDVHATLRRAA
jgi:hypothetical protein